MTALPASMPVIVHVSALACVLRTSQILVWAVESKVLTSPENVSCPCTAGRVYAAPGGAGGGEGGGEGGGGEGGGAGGGDGGGGDGGGGDGGGGDGGGGEGGG